MKYKKRTSVLFGAVGLCALSLSAAEAATSTWDGGANGDGFTFSTAANWTGDTRPAAGSDVVFDPTLVNSPGPMVTRLYLAAATTSATLGSWTFNSMTFQNQTAALSIGANSSTDPTVRTLTLSGASPGITLASTTTSTITFGRDTFGGPLNLALTGVTTMNIANSSAQLTLGFSDTTTNTLSITGSGTIVKTGAGTLRINTTSTSGITGFTVNEGVLDLGGVNTMGILPSSSNAAFYTLDGGTIRFRSTINSTALSSFRGFTLGANGGTLEVNSGVTIRTLARFVESAPGAALTKTGAGTFIMDSTGNSDYTGSTSVLAGTLLIDSGVNLISSPVTVATGANFGGSGTMGGALTVGGVLTPGMSTGTATGTLTVNNTLTLQSTASTLFELGASDYDKIRGVTNLVLDGTITVSLLDLYTPSTGDVFQLFGWSGSIDYSNFNVLADLILPTFADSGMSWDTSNFLTDGTIVAVPEPGTVMLMALSAGLFLWVRKVRRVAR